ncbi:Ubiquitin-activating enzyme E1-like [Astathelohania contejeani]|uniref:NEDD8-activating enzyme E1 catalytic subunit n=1 Tax=Astathelohania contejeani TaxID=164912 RepID=A0ABQ7HW75_9MICR|nr:Ubiquitin-activating enzyme E1-like [Thelohania contejeani]
MAETQILVVGCGGIGSEIIKLLYLTKQDNITLVDYDTIELTNLNRQFLFTHDYVGGYKAHVCSQAYKKKLPNANIQIITKSIDSLGLKFFQQFSIVYNCLDNVEARSYVNLRCRLASIPLVDGGSAGFLGQAMPFIIPYECYDCVPKTVKREFPICTIRSQPTNYEHCVIWARNFFLEEINKKKEYKSKRIKIKKELIDTIVKDNTEYNEEMQALKESIKNDIQYLEEKYTARQVVYSKEDAFLSQLIYKVAVLRSLSYDITPDTFINTETIAGNIIPSIATTNSIIAALMIYEGEKILNGSKEIFNYFLTKNKRLILKVQGEEGNINCICQMKKYIYYYTDELLLIDLLDAIGIGYDVDVLSDDAIIYDKDSKDNLHKNVFINEKYFIIIMSNEIHLFVYLIKSEKEGLTFIGGDITPQWQI